MKGTGAAQFGQHLFSQEVTIEVKFTVEIN
jgi:hypothetical protein